MKDGKRCLEKEREALLKIKYELIDEYGQFSSWENHKDKKDCYEWRGFLCNNLTNHIIELDPNGLYENGEKRIAIAPPRGNISIWLLEIQNLKHLDLSFNDFDYIRIPQFIGSLCKLQYLDLSHSNFSGEISRHLGNLSQLQFLGLDTDDGMLTSTNIDWLSRLHSLSYRS
ncbi:unnamed protein product [Fraxinus pennsylvanica]|uniref:Leucine-rich repeat-containing N-terminal plant-type domain-containing protein n=1 Tax=Fraxinus pennsylvanica TaxID=56036 RepID=A0AAD1ZHX9_9LAMI|nr:unnamed protein product [Fraxinus pennsylvanica]